MPKKTVSICDIAQIAGVSTATVSKVLNGKGSISQETRDKVMAIVRREGYVASFAAQTLRSTSTHTVGIVAPDISNYFFSSIVLDVETLLYDAGYTCYICNSHNEMQRAERYLTSLVQRQVDALVLVSGSPHPSLALLPQKTPVLAIDVTSRLDHDNVVSVHNDWPAMVEDAAHALLDKGCSHIGLLGLYQGNSDVEEMDTYTSFKRALDAKDTRLDRNLLLHGKGRQDPRIEAAELVGQCLDDGFEMDGLVCIGDRPALGACEAIKQRGLVVGKDVLVIGSDDSLPARTATPTLSSINRHVNEIAKCGVEALLDMLAGKELDEHEILIPHEVVERDSTRG